MPEIFIGLKDPVDSSKFDKYEVDNINVYINKDIKLEDNVRVKFSEYASDLPDKEFEIVGVSIPRPN